MQAVNSRVKALTMFNQGEPCSILLWAMLLILFRIWIRKFLPLEA